MPVRQEAGWAPELRSSDGKICLYPRPESNAQYFVTRVEFKRLYVTAYLTVIIANNKNADNHSSN